MSVVVGGEVVVREAAVPPVNDDLVDAAWQELVSTNPRLYDGPILVVERIEGPVIYVRRDRYRTLATASMLNRSVRALGVQGVVIGRDSTGKAHLLCGHRSPDTRIYGGMWENAPSGSVTLQESVTELRVPDLTQVLLTEGLEELGFDFSNAAVRSLGVLDDPFARSLDVVLELDLYDAINPRVAMCVYAADRRWEYIDSKWIALRIARGWADNHRNAVSPPTLELLARLALPG